MKTLRYLSALCSAALLISCAVGPNYGEPALPEGAKSSFHVVSSALETSAVPSEKWWRLYDDRVLDQLIEEALTANTEIVTAEANIGSARALLDAASAGRFPNTTASAGSIYGRDARTEQILEINRHEPVSGWTFSSILDASYELDLFGHVQRSIEASRADTGAAEAARDAVKITVAAETARAYAQICALGEEIAVANRSLDVVSHETEITVDRHDAGANSRLDVLRSQGLMAQVQASIPPLEGQRLAALYQLSALLGRPPSAAPTELMNCASPPALSANLPVGDGTAMLKRRPDVRQAERRLAAATARIGVATADLYPRISLNALYGSVSPDISALTSGQALTWGVGPTINWAFPIQAGPRARVKQAEAGAAAALGAFDTTVIDALRETETVLAKYLAEIRRHVALSDAHRKDREAYELASEAYRAGSLSNLDLLVSEQSLVSADAALATSDATLVDDQILIFKALGGGWERLPAGTAGQNPGTDPTEMDANSR